MNLMYGQKPDGNIQPISIDPSGSLNLSYGHIQASSLALEKSHVVKASAGRFRKVRVVNTDVADRYVQVHDAAALPADTSVPKLWRKVLAGEETTLEFDWDCATGIVVALSSTSTTLTIVTTNVAWFNARAD